LFVTMAKSADDRHRGMKPGRYDYLFKHWSW